MTVFDVSLSYDKGLTWTRVEKNSLDVEFFLYRDIFTILLAGAKFVFLPGSAVIGSGRCSTGM